MKGGILVIYTWCGLVRQCVFSGLIALLIGSASAQPSSFQGPAITVDGDTILLEDSQGFVRLFGIDAPELNQTCLDANNRPYGCGQQAAHFLQSLLAQTKNVRCRTHSVDIYGRIVAECSANGIDLGEQLIRNGWALEEMRYSDGRYRAPESSARSQKRGIWAGKFEKPARWRRENASHHFDHGDRQCRIKGNISVAGKIYHLPGTEAYPKVRITPEKGERWFCSESEAAGAGWRPAKSFN